MSEPTARTRINCTKWIWRVVTWDGVLPLVMFGLPYLIHWLLPNLDVNQELPVKIGIGVICVTGAIRTWVVYLYIHSNACSQLVRKRQELAMVFGLTMLSGFDWFMAHLVLNGRMLAPEEQILGFCAVLYVMSLSLMIFALYPGREPIPSTQLGNWEIEC